MVTITSKASRPEWQRAMVKATEQYQAGARARWLGGRRYEVPSATTSAVYVVEVLNPTTLQATCTCPHGQRADEPHCWHVALAICAAIERVTRKPRPVPQPTPRPSLPPAAVTEAENAAAIARLFPRAA